MTGLCGEKRKKKKAFSELTLKKYTYIVVTSWYSSLLKKPTNLPNKQKEQDRNFPAKKSVLNFNGVMELF